MDLDTDESYGISHRVPHQFVSAPFRINESLEYLAYGPESNGTSRENCFMPKTWNCSDSYNKHAQMRMEDLLTNAAIAKYIIFGLALLSNGTTLWVITQRKYKTKLVPNTLVFLYVANIFYLGFMTFSNHGVSFENTRAFDEVNYCKYTSLIASAMRAVTNWILVCVSLIQISTILCPYSCVRFRINPNHSWIILGFVLTIAIVSTGRSVISSELINVCNVQKKILCVFRVPLSHLIVNYTIPLSITILSSILIVISSFRPAGSRFKTESQSSRRVNRIILASTFLFALTTCPLLGFLFWTQLTPGRKPCSDSFYARTMIRVVIMNLSIMNFSLDSFLFMVVSPPFRRDVIELYTNMYCCLLIRRRKRQASVNSIRQSSAKDASQKCDEMKEIGVDQTGHKNSMTIDNADNDGTPIIYSSSTVSKSVEPAQTRV